MRAFLRRNLVSFVPGPLKIWLVTRLRQRPFPIPAAPRAFVFLSADYGNIGDLAISAAQCQFLEASLPGYSVVPVPISATREVMRSIRRQIAPGDLVTTIGGGNMGSLYPDIEDLRQLVIRSFPRNRVVCFPQTLDWDESAASTKALAKIVRVYGDHSALHLFARESVSVARLRELFSGCASVTVAHVPDIVLSATAASLGARGCASPAGALLCLRDDRERSLGDDHRQQLQEALVNAGLNIQVTDTHAGGARLSSERCAQLLADKLTQFQSAQLVVTDRLHGMILAALAGTPCLVLPNTNHKIHQTWQDWLTAVPQLHFLALDELARVSTAVEALLAVPRRDSEQAVIDPLHFADLRATLQNS